MNKIRVTSVPSRIPGWYDPGAPGFAAPKTWQGTHVRLGVPVSLDPARELATARANAEKLYPGAVLHLVPEFQQKQVKQKITDVQGSDEQLLEGYLAHVVLPEGTNVNQVVGYLAPLLGSSGLFGVQGLQFESVVATETLCFHHIKFALNDKGLTLVTGRNKDWNENISNGAGKSSLMSLPFIALFGRTFKGQTFDGWARQDTDAVSMVTLRLMLPDGSNLSIQRGRRPAVLRVFRDNGKEITMGKPEQTQQLIERLTNLTWEVLTNAVYIGQRELGSVFGTDKERQELFSRLLGLDRFLDVYAKVRKAMQRAQKEVEELDLALSAVKASATEAEQNLRLIQEALASMPAIDSKSAERDEQTFKQIEQDIHALEQDNKAREPWLEENQKRLGDWLDKGHSAQAESRVLCNQIKASSGLKGKCPLCFSRVTVDTLSTHLLEIQQRVDELDKQAAKYELLVADNRKNRLKVIEKIQQNNETIRQRQRLLSTYVESKIQREEQRRARSHVEGMVSEKHDRLVFLQQIERTHDQAKTAWMHERRFLEFCAESVGRGGLPAYLCSVVAPSLNQAAVRYSEIFTQGEIGLTFTATHDDMTLDVRNLHGGKNFKDQSEGESCLAARIAAFAFREVLVRFNILIMDEPTQGLDEANAIAFARGLNAIKDRFEHVIVISHNASMLAGLEPDRHIVVTKQNGVATVESI